MKSNSFEKICSKAILILTIILFGWLFVNSFVYSSSVYYKLNSFISLIIAFAVLFSWFLIFKFISSKSELTKKHEILFVICYFIVIILFEIFTLIKVDLPLGWDYGVIYNDAKFYATHGSLNQAPLRYYLTEFPNNVMLFKIEVYMIKIGKIFGLNAKLSCRIFNLIIINIAMLMLYFTTRKIFRKKGAIFSLIVSLFFIPIFLYCPIFYSDTFSLFIGISIIYMFLQLKEDNKQSIDLIKCILMGILLFLGIEIKITAIIVFVAVFICSIIEKNFKLLFKLSIGLIICMIFVFGFKRLYGTKYLTEGYKPYPHTHWIMMGLEDKNADNSGRNSIGGYNSKDYELTKKHNYSSKFNINEYKRRYKELGFTDYIKYLTLKDVNIWSDGMYYSDIALSFNNKNLNKYEKFIISEKPIKYFMQGVQFAFLLSLILGSILKLLMKNNKPDYVRLSIIGILLFLTFWEARSRYLYNFIPIFILIITEFNVNITKQLKTKKFK